MRPSDSGFPGDTRGEGRSCRRLEAVASWELSGVRGSHRAAECGAACRAKSGWHRDPLAQAALQTSPRLRAVLSLSSQYHLQHRSFYFG